MLAFSRRQFLITAGLGGAAVLLPRWLKRQGGGGVADTAVQAGPLVNQEWVFGLSFPAFFPVLPAVVDPTPTAVPTATPTQTAAPSATPTATAAPTQTGTAVATATATIQPQSNNLYLPLVAVGGTSVPAKETP